MQQKQNKEAGLLPERCVAVETVKAHHPDDLPLHKGDIIEVLDVDRENSRIKGIQMEKERKSKKEEEKRKAMKNGKEERTQKECS